MTLIDYQKVTCIVKVHEHCICDNSKNELSWRWGVPADAKEMSIISFVLQDWVPSESAILYTFYNCQLTTMMTFHFSIRRSTRNSMIRRDKELWILLVREKLHGNYSVANLWMNMLILGAHSEHVLPHRRFLQIMLGELLVSACILKVRPVHLFSFYSVLPAENFFLPFSHW
jgi:hypothetical protein